MSHDRSGRAVCFKTIRIHLLQFDHTFDSTRRDRCGRWLWRLVRRAWNPSASDINQPNVASRTWESHAWARVTREIKERNAPRHALANVPLTGGYFRSEAHLSRRPCARHPFFDDRCRQRSSPDLSPASIQHTQPSAPWNLNLISRIAKYRRTFKMSHDRGWRGSCCSEHGS